MAVSAFPFSAVVGMDDMRLALVLNAISPAIGGVLVRGEKGTAKSTAVRALAAVLPAVSVVPGCRFSCDPAAPDPECPDGPHAVDGPVDVRAARLVELPVGASEDRLTGSLDIERALTEGVKSFEPGLLAGANRGVLYVDEVNLLHDHLVDLLLDAAALGTSYVERDGVSVRHAARFLLVGTMNPEEGELRPQLLDRFGLTVEVTAPVAPAERAEVVRRRLAFDADPVSFGRRYAHAERELAVSIVAARRALESVELGDAALHQIASVCAAFGVDGLRADIVTARAAAAHAAWHGRTAVEAEDVRAAARLALPHRRRRNPFDAPGLDEQLLDDALRDASPPSDDPDPDPDPGGGADPDPNPPSGDQHSDSVDMRPESSVDHGDGTQVGPASTRTDPPAATFRARRLEVPGLGTGAAGRRSRAVTDHGQVVRAIRPVGRASRIHVTATLIAAAPHQIERGRADRRGLVLRRDDLRAAQREGREGNLVLFVVDASGSMAAQQRMGAVKGAVLSLLLDAYQRRDKVGLIAFREAGAELLLPPTSSVDAAAARLRVMPTGGRTPLTAGLLAAHGTLALERLRDPDRRPLVVVVTDGRHTAGGDPQRAAHLFARDGVASIVIDCENGHVRLGLAATLAEQLGAQCLRLGELAADAIVRTVKDAA
ncbi:MAG TPA: putative cobaltochelatase [Jatrophihabitantaceae bacterium]|nr:putative cobaltochelatase [Jatrophihabitantaceae bacterium]